MTALVGFAVLDLLSALADAAGGRQHRGRHLLGRDRRHVGVVGYFWVQAALDDAAVLEDDDQVGVADRREAVGDDERRPAGEQPPERAARSSARCRCRRTTSPRRGRGSAGRRAAPARTRRAGAGRARGARRAPRAPSRSRPRARATNVVAPTACAAATISSSRRVGPAERDVVAHRAGEEEALLRHDRRAAGAATPASRRGGRGRRS